MTALLIATRNAHKVREIRQVLAADYLYLSLDDFPGAPAVVEDGATFAANAAKKVNVLADWLATNSGRVPTCRDRAETRFSDLYILADDSGLEVDALDGAPGVHSARFAALDAGLPGNSPDSVNNAKLLRLLEGVPPSRRTARFRCVLALRALSLPSAEVAIHPEAALNPQSAIRNPQFSTQAVLLEATCSGLIALQPAGSGGFGYDPLFIPDGFTRSFAELGEGVKNILSHRARALEKLRQHLAVPAV
jgi:XTP/dITP diphosphohydrolase